MAINRLVPFGAIFFFVVILFAVPFSLSASGSSGSGPILTTTYTLMGAPRQSTLGGLPCIKANYLNAASSITTFGVVYAIAHNPLGQTVLMTTAAITPAAGANSTAFLILAGLPGGVYSVSVFAVDENEIAISLSSNVQVTL